MTYCWGEEKMEDLVGKTFTRVYEEDGEKIESEKILPPLSLNEKLLLIKLDPSQHFTKPPARFSDASLVKALEEYGIGRPSTYAPTIRTVVTRNYVRRREGKMRTSEKAQDIFWKYRAGKLTYKELKEETDKLADKQAHFNFNKKENDNEGHKSY